MNFNVFDLEGDGLTPTKIHCIAAEFNGKVMSTSSYENMKKFFSKETYFIGHNIIRFDIPAVERLLGIKVRGKFIDTLALSWYLYPERPKHGLEEWGEYFGVPKPPIDDWENLTVEEYMHRCEEDVKINTKLWEMQWKLLLKIYGSEEEALALIDYLSFKLDCAREQEASRWKLDIDKCNKGILELRKELDEKTNLLALAMPKIPVEKIQTKPPKPFKKDGTLSIQGAKWFSLLKEQKLPEEYDGSVKVVIKWEDPNPSSSDQIKSWLYELGWVPSSFKYVRNKETNEFRKIPQVRIEEDGEKVLCPSVVKLIEKEPSIEHLKSITVLQHRIGILEGFLSNVSNDGYVKAEVAGLTNTLRFKHKVCVNLPGVAKPYGELIRGCLTSPDGYELCGSDQSSLEDRTKQHFMWEYDPDYVTEMNTPGFDPHLDIAIIANLMTKEEVEKYKAGDHSKKPIRHKAKTANYACTYGVTPEGLVRNAGLSLKDASVLHKAYWKRNWSLTAIADNCVVKKVEGKVWLYNPVSKLYYLLRHNKDRFSTLNQGTATYCFDIWVKNIRSKRPQLTAQFHDEVVLCIKEGFREQCTSLLKWAVDKVNVDLKLNRKLDVDVQFSKTYAGVH